MITTEEIAIKVREMLIKSALKDAITGTVDYERNDYSKEDVIIIPRTSDGEGSVRTAYLNVNIHVPDLPMRVGNSTVYRTDYKRLIELRAIAIQVLERHYEVGSGWNWSIGELQPPFKEAERNEHFVSLTLEVTIRVKKQS